MGQSENKLRQQKNNEKNKIDIIRAKNLGKAKSDKQAQREDR